MMAEWNQSTTAAPQFWRNATVSVPRLMKLDTFDSKMQTLVVERLRQDVGLLQEVRRKKAIITYETDIWIGFCDENILTPKSDEEHRFGAVGDLFSDPNAAALELKVDVELAFTIRPANVARQPGFNLNRKTGKGELLDVEELVVELNSLEADRWEYVYLRLGHIEPAEFLPPPGSDLDEYIPNSNDTVSDNPPHDAWLREMKVVHTPRVIVAYWQRGYGAFPDSLKLTVVQGWNFGDYFIGEKTQNYEKYNFDPADMDAIYLEPFENVANTVQLHAAIRQNLRGNQADRDPIAFMPSLTLNTYNAKSLGLGVKGKPVDIVVRYVNHLANVPYSGQSDLWLPYNAQWTVEPRASPRDLNAALLLALMRHSGNTSLGPEESQAIRSLYSNSLGGTWELQLWVLPQTATGSGGKMYRYPSAGQEDKLGLGHFLSPERVRAGGSTARALYVEAHVVSKAEDDEDRIAGATEDDEDRIAGATEEEDEEEQGEVEEEEDEGEELEPAAEDEQVEGEGEEDDEELEQAEDRMGGVGNGAYSITDSDEEAEEREERRRTSRKVERKRWRPGGLP